MNFPWKNQVEMAATRERRSNAGTRIANLLNNEEEDEEFYKTSYGGFHEIEDDRDYVQKKTAEDDDDSVDSDFSIDEDDEVISDNEEAEKKRKKGIVTRAYKEPPKNQAKKSPQKATKSPAKPKRTAESGGPRRGRRATYTVFDSAKISLRQSTALKSAATEHRVKAYKEAKSKRPKMYRSDDTMPTQKELLAEAEITAKENLESLEKFKQMEVEKKKMRPTKRVNVGPIIRYQSLTMPAISEVTLITQIKHDNDGDHAMDVDEHPIQPTMPVSSTRSGRRTGTRSMATAAASSGRIERTFITFENDIDDDCFTEVFNKPRKIRRRNEPILCALTRLPAKYIDPVTRAPYRNIQALKIIRESYYQLLQSSNSQQAEKWLEWRKKVKEAKKSNDW